MRILPVGDRGLLAEFDDQTTTLHAHAALSSAVIEGVVELVPAARTVLVHLDPRVVGLGHVEHWVRETVGTVELQGPAGVETTLGATQGESGATVRIPVQYDGEDLAAVAKAWGCDVDEVARRHAATEWVCAFVGFAPGFPYLVPVGDPLPEVPRRDTSRARVPAGAVALAADYCGVYPRESPGGWQLIGRTSLQLWDARRDPPALVTAGTRVRFEPLPGADSGTRTGTDSRAGSSLSAGERAIAPEEVPAESAGTASAGGRAAEVPELVHTSRVHVVDPGALTLVHDLGRSAMAALGVSGSGVFDRAAHRLANRLVGNDETAAGLEVLLGGLVLTLPAGTWFAITGADGPATLNGAPTPLRHAVLAERGGELRLGVAEHGLRYSLAVRGGIDAEPELGSRARDTLSGIGPAPLTAASILTIGSATELPVPAVDLVPVDAPPDGVTELPIRPGPRREWFSDEAWTRMLEARWTVSARSDRTGVRLEGPPVDRAPEAVGRELPSEGMLRGSVQVSPDGAPTVLGPDHPVTGGYPVIAVVTDDGLDRLAQLRPGQEVRLHLVAGRY